MKKIIFLFVFLLFHTIAQADSLEVFSAGIYEPTDIHFIDEYRGYLCGEGGIWETWSSGQDWYWSYGSSNWQDSTHGMYDFEFCDDGTAYAVGWRGVRISDTLWEFHDLVLKSTNAGITWSDVMSHSVGSYSMHDWKENTRAVRNHQIIANAPSILLAVACSSSQQIVVSGNFSRIFRSSNGGMTWQEYSTGWNSIEKFLQRGSVFYGGEFDRLVKSTNQGQNWSTVNLDPLPSIYSIAYVGSNMIIGGTERENWSLISTAYSTNDGMNWTSIAYRDSGYFTDMVFVDQKIGYASASNPMVFGQWNTPTGYVFKTIDGGLSWDKIYEQLGMEIQATCRRGKYVFFAARGSTLRLRLVTTSVSSNSEKVSAYGLGQNYPNPFNPVTTINFSLPKNSFVSLKIYDVAGKEVAVLVNELKTAGTYSVDFNGANLSSGIYFYRLQAGDFVETKKMILQK